jgi:DNA-binding transcriptional MocR family regulator
MSYKIDLSDIDRDGSESITQQLVDRFTAAIDDGRLEPGEKLPTTRALAADVGVNHLTAARVYRRLAELGYVTASVGRGTFVRSVTPAPPGTEGDTDDWQTYVLPEYELSYAEQVQGDSFRLPDEPGMISLSTGWPSPKLYPTEELARITADVFAEEGGAALSYITAEGLWALREQLAEIGRERGFATGPDEIIVTSGARQAIDLTMRTLLEPGDVALVESPTFVGILSSLRAARAKVIGVPVDADGLDVTAVERLLARHEVKVCVLQPNCQNPTGRDLSTERRDRLARLALERNFFVVEDHVYAAMRFEGEDQRPLREDIPGHSIYINSLSKTVGGGLRIGWIAARGPVRDRLAALKLDSDFHTATITQHMAARYLASGGYSRQLARTVPFYRERRDALVAALGRHLAGEYRVDVPRGGHHVWVTLTRPIDERALYREAVRHGVTFTPGIVVRPERSSTTQLRLSFSLVDPAELDEGVRRLARAIREVRRRDRGAATVPVS